MDKTLLSNSSICFKSVERSSGLRDIGGLAFLVDFRCLLFFSWTTILETDSLDDEPSTVALRFVSSVGLLSIGCDLSRGTSILLFDELCLEWVTESCSTKRDSI